MSLFSVSPKSTDSAEDVKNVMKNADNILCKDGTWFQRSEYEIVCYFDLQEDWL